MEKIRNFILTIVIIVPIIRGTSFLYTTGMELLRTNDKIAGVFDGSLQQEYETIFQDNFFGKEELSYLYRAWKYWALHELSGDWMVARDNFLFSKSQTKSYLSRQSSIKPEEYDDYAQKIRIIQDRLKSEGKLLIFMLTPFKAEIYEEKLPINYQIVFDQYNQIVDDDYSRLKKALATHGVNYYDTKDNIL